MNSKLCDAPKFKIQAKRTNAQNYKQLYLEEIL